MKDRTGNTGEYHISLMAEVVRTFAPIGRQLTSRLPKLAIELSLPSVRKKEDVHRNDGQTH